MIRSMTAYARSVEQGDWGVLTVEIRSVNHRYLDLTMRLPEQLREFEPKLRELCQSKISRGKVEVQVRFEAGVDNSDLVSSVSVNQAFAQQYADAVLELDKLLGERSSGINPTQMAQQPQVLTIQKPDIAHLKDQLFLVLESGLLKLLAAREGEGEKLASIILEKLAQLRLCIEQVKPVVPEMIEQQKEKILNRIDGLSASIDPERLEQELVLYAQKIDVEEEIDRLFAHIKTVENIFVKGGAVGRRLDFLMQELNREANTLGSKSVTVQSSQCSIDLKVLIEQMREQVQNIE